LQYVSTIDAFLIHGIIKESLGLDATRAREAVGSLKNFGIDINKVCVKLLNDGVMAFEDAFNLLIKAIENKEERL
jgi:ribulose 1,5-bisphosphate carboxylase large subunit-like protein